MAEQVNLIINESKEYNLVNTLGELKKVDAAPTAEGLYILFRNWSVY